MLNQEKLYEYIWLIEKWNLKINLVSYKNLSELIINNIIDSLSVLEVYKFNDTDVVADIGSGPGLPGVVLALMFPNTKFYLVEPRKKYFMFLKVVIRKLKIKNIVLKKKRIEEVNEKFNIFLNRAVSDINSIIKLISNNIVKSESNIFSYKGKNFYKEFPVKKENVKINQIKKIKILEIYNKSLYIIALKV